MKHEQSAPAGYRPRFAGTMKLYLVRHKEYGELTVNGVNKYEAVHAAARKWGVRWTAIARECEYIVLAEDTPEGGSPGRGRSGGNVADSAAAGCKPVSSSRSSSCWGLLSRSGRARSGRRSSRKSRSRRKGKS